MCCVCGLNNLRVPKCLIKSIQLDLRIRQTPRNSNLSEGLFKESQSGVDKVASEDDDENDDKISQ